MRDKPELTVHIRSHRPDGIVLDGRGGAIIKLGHVLTTAELAALVQAAGAEGLSPRAHILRAFGRTDAELLPP